MCDLTEQVTFHEDNIYMKEGCTYKQNFKT
jgi:hypothetical protein